MRQQEKRHRYLYIPVAFALAISLRIAYPDFVKAFFLLIPLSILALLSGLFVGGFLSEEYPNYEYYRKFAKILALLVLIITVMVFSIYIFIVSTIPFD